ncbi:MAG: type II toxin-antitoxin system VapB family antitoxin [Polyangiaceae bacterium]|nr:type II toxin-antitoxin system VapB family antitoxin [Polyangiaceae bacterium]
MRTTVDIDDALLERAKKLALKERQTLGSVVNRALAGYLGGRKSAVKDEPFELLVRGDSLSRFPTQAEILAAEEEEDVASLAVLGLRRRAAP